MNKLGVFPSKSMEDLLWHENPESNTKEPCTMSIREETAVNPLSTQTETVELASATLLRPPGKHPSFPVLGILCPIIFMDSSKRRMPIWGSSCIDGWAVMRNI